MNESLTLEEILDISSKASSWGGYTSAPGDLYYKGYFNPKNGDQAEVKVSKKINDNMPIEYNITVSFKEVVIGEVPGDKAKELYDKVTIIIKKWNEKRQEEATTEQENKRVIGIARMREYFLKSTGFNLNPSDVLLQEVLDICKEITEVHKNKEDTAGDAQMWGDITRRKKNVKVIASKALLEEGNAGKVMYTAQIRYSESSRKYSGDHALTSFEGEEAKNILDRLLEIDAADLEKKLQTKKEAAIKKNIAEARIIRAIGRHLVFFSQLFEKNGELSEEELIELAKEVHCWKFRTYGAYEGTNYRNKRYPISLEIRFHQDLRECRVSVGEKYVLAITGDRANAVFDYAKSAYEEQERRHSEENALIKPKAVMEFRSLLADEPGKLPLSRRLGR